MARVDRAGLRGHAAGILALCLATAAAALPYRDAAYAMLTLDRTVIIADEGLKQSLKAALVEWAMADFEHRLENRSQAYGMEQLLRYIGPTAVVGIPKLMTRDAKR